MPPFFNAAVIGALLIAASSVTAQDAVIDTHAHILLPGQEYSLTPNASGSPDALREQMAASGVSKAGILSMVAGSNLEQMIVHNDYVLTLANDAPEEFFAIASVHPLDGQAALDEIVRVAGLGAKGIKVHPFYQGFDVADPAVAEVVRVAGEQGLTVLFDSISPADGGMVGKFVNLALANPETKIVLAHMGGTRFHEMLLFAVLSEGPWYNNNVFFDLSAVASLYEGSPRQDELIWTIREIGVEQFMFGSDFPIFNLESSKEIMDGYGFTNEEMQMLLHDSAVVAYGL